VDVETRTLGKTLTAIEERHPGWEALVPDGPPPVQRIGVTGPPGSGKSTLVDQLIKRFRAAGKRVAVVAVDPSSPLTGGALLGDRIRMQGHALDPGVFIRSMASRSHLGGLAKATGEMISVLAGAGFDLVLVETVGVGQSEVEVVRHVDTVVVVLEAGWGDVVQAEKAGILEIADLLVVNKSDRGGEEQTVRILRAALGEGVPVVVTTATTGEGLDVLAGLLLASG
jgi:LAO/AO transport system kinase